MTVSGVLLILCLVLWVVGTVAEFYVAVTDPEKKHDDPP